MSTENFVPRMIGLQDTENHQRIRNLYINLTGALSVYLWDIQRLLKDETINPDWIILILKMNMAELVLFLKKEYIRRNEISFPGLNVEKLISQDLIELPEEYDEIILVHNFNNEQNKLIEDLKFNFPLSKLKTEDGFNLNEEFETELLEFTASFTASEKQNEVLDAVQKFCDLVLEMQDLGIISKKKGAWGSMLNIISDSIVENPKQDPPIFPWRFMFTKNSAFSKFLTDAQIQQKTRAFKPIELEE